MAKPLVIFDSQTPRAAATVELSNVVGVQGYDQVRGVAFSDQNGTCEIIQVQDPGDIAIPISIIATVAVVAGVPSIIGPVNVNWKFCACRYTTGAVNETIKRVFVWGISAS